MNCAVFAFKNLDCVNAIVVLCDLTSCSSVEKHKFLEQTAASIFIVRTSPYENSYI